MKTFEEFKKSRFSMLEDFWMPQGFHQSPVQQAPQTPQIIAKCHRDPRTLEYVVIPLTSVYVEKSDGTLIEHETKHMHSFDGPVAVPNVPPGTYKFRTDNDAWPYMYVSMSLFETKPIVDPKKSDPFGKETLTTATELDFDSGPRPKKNINDLTRDEMRATIISGELPPKDELTKRQIKRMRKKSKCPDCSHEYWDHGPSQGEQQMMRCKGCASKFTVTPTNIFRVI